MTETDETTEYLVSLTPHLWAIAIVFFGAGDLITTFAGLPLQSTVEVGPLAAHVYQQFGAGIMVVLKAAVISGAYVLWRVVPSPQRVGIPLGLSTLGVLVTIWNLSVLYAVHV